MREKADNRGVILTIRIREEDRARLELYARRDWRSMGAEAWVMIRDYMDAHPLEEDDD